MDNDCTTKIDRNDSLIEVENQFSKVDENKDGQIAAESNIDNKTIIVTVN